MYVGIFCFELFDSECGCCFGGGDGVWCCVNGLVVYCGWGWIGDWVWGNVWDVEVDSVWVWDWVDGWLMEKDDGWGWFYNICISKKYCFYLVEMILKEIVFRFFL